MLYRSVVNGWFAGKTVGFLYIDHFIVRSFSISGRLSGSERKNERRAVANQRDLKTVSEWPAIQSSSWQWNFSSFIGREWLLLLKLLTSERTIAGHTNAATLLSSKHWNDLHQPFGLQTDIANLSVLYDSLKLSVNQSLFYIYFISYFCSDSQNLNYTQND
jgi:hypothetical protein